MVDDGIRDFIRAAALEQAGGQVDVCETVEYLTDLTMGTLIKKGARTLGEREKQAKARRLVGAGLARQHDFEIAADLGGQPLALALEQILRRFEQLVGRGVPIRALGFD